MRPDGEPQHGAKKTLGVIALTSCAATAAHAQFGTSSNPLAVEQPHATMRLATEHAALTPGDQEIAVIFTIDDQWHLYWQNPGDTGLPPEITLTLPDGIEQTALPKWPAPKRYIHGGGQLLDYIYEHEFALLVPVSVDPALTGSTIEIGATASWLVCKEACIQGNGEATLRTSVRSEAAEASPDAEIILASKDRTPLPATDKIKSRWDATTLHISIPGTDRLTAYPLTPRLAGPIDPITDGHAQGDSLAIRFDPRVVSADTVVLVIESNENGSTDFHHLELPAPRPTN